MPLEYLKILTVIWASLWLGMAVYRLARGQFSSVYCLMIVFYGLFIGPLLLDVTVGPPDYVAQPGFALSQNDLTVNLIYLAYVAFIPPLWFRYARLSSIAFKLPTPHLAFLALVAGMAAGPLLLLLIYPDALGYVTQYGNVLGMDRDTSGAIPVGPVTTLSVLAVVLLALLARNTWMTLYWMLPLATLAMWMNGKRAIVAIFLVTLLIALIYKGVLRGWSLLLAPLFFGAAFLIFSSVYQADVRSKSSYYIKTDIETYTGARVDFGRDDVTKMAIFAELYPDQMQILEYRGQSFLFSLMPWVPRAVWANKPLPYAQYLTSAMLGTPPTLRSWSMTTSFLEESISNLGWLGLLFGPLALLWLCNYGDRPRRMEASVLTVIVASLLLSVEIVAFYPILAGYAAYVFWANRRAAQDARMALPA